MFAVLLFEFSAVEVDAIFGVHPVAMFLEEPFHAIEVAAFLVGGEGENQTAIMEVAFFFEANKSGEQQSVASFHIVGATAVEESVFFDELEGVSGPVFATSFHDIQVANK